MLIICDDSLSYFSKNLICPDTGISYERPEPNTFSFNSPSGMCKNCNGLGNVYNIDLDLLIPDKSKSIYNGGITALGVYKDNWVFKQLNNISNKYNFDIKDPISKIPKKALEIILYGGKKVLRLFQNLLD
jgi:excinuclease ABC subunit A